MVKITDRTLSCLDETTASKSDLSCLLEMLIKSGVDRIELSEKMYDLLSPLPDYPSYILRIEHSSMAAECNDISLFVCGSGAFDQEKNYRSEILFNIVNEDCTLPQIPLLPYAESPEIRILGLGDALLGDYQQAFERIKKANKGNIEFCPSNNYHMATALATEWVTNNISENIVTSFCGVGGFAPTEELIIILRERCHRKADSTYPFFPEMVNVMERITGIPVSNSKPILGRRIFHVESSIHVDGILKQPKCYEPFPPEVVGQTRKVFIGKQSGAASIRAKLGDLGIKYSEERISQILSKVKTVSFEKNSVLSDNEFLQIARGYLR